ncbi:MAG: hypothetical protein JWN14_2044 [Chthonomonadales bacterium]|nr:hypothetical protein [Chthonomonadales bacterium]
MRRPGASRSADSSPRRYNRETFTSPNLLLVEGPDEFQFFRFLRSRDDVQIHVYEGKNQLQLELKTIRAVEGYDQIKRVAIVRDADTDPTSAVQSVLTQWALAIDEPLPRVNSDQWFGDSEGRQWSVWIMPDPNTEGDLEALLWRTVDQSDHRTCIEDLITCLDNCDPVPFSTKTKARLYSWLSTQREPLKELYAAFNPGKGLFDAANPAFARFAALVDNM